MGETITLLEGSFLCYAMYKGGTVAECRKLLVANKDFTISNAELSLSFSTDISDADVLLVQYSFPWIFTVGEFSQQFFLDVFDDDFKDMERRAALAVAMIFTNHNDLVRSFSESRPVQHSISDHLHSLWNIHFLEGTPTLISTPYQMRLKFIARGETRLVNNISGDYTLIEGIHSHHYTGSTNR